LDAASSIGFTGAISVLCHTTIPEEDAVNLTAPPSGAW
jgi:hypothetical protein